MRRVLLCFVLALALAFMISCSEGEDNNPVPVLSSISPSSSVANMPGFSLVLRGSNFVQNSTVNFGGSSKSATFVSSTELHCQINPADIPGSAVYNGTDTGDINLMNSNTNVYVVNPSPGGGNSNTMVFTVQSNPEYMTQTNISNDNYESSHTRIGIDAQNSLDVVWDIALPAGNSKIIFTRSTDRGITWSSQVSVSAEKSDATRPDIAVKSTGELNVVWMENLSQYDVYFGRSTDNGATWTTPLNISNTLTVDSYYPAVAVDNYGNLNVVWIENRRMSTNNVWLRDIYFSRSTNGGTVWSAPALLYETKCVCPPAIAVDSAGRIFVAYRFGELADEGEILVISSGDGGTSWSSPKLVSVGAGDAINPSLAVDSNGYVNLAWQQIVSGDYDIFHARSTDLGANWNQPVNVSQTYGESRRPSITVDSLGNLIISWDDNTLGGEDVFQSRSANNGATWSEYTNISLNAGDSWDSDNVVDSGCNVCIVWLDKTPGSTEIYFIKSVIAGLLAD